MGNADAGPVGPVGPLSHYRRINTKMRKEHLLGGGLLEARSGVEPD